MKKNAAIRIVLYSLLIVFLLGVLLVGLGVSGYSFLTDRADSYTTAESAVELDCSLVDSLEIQWASGDIQILCSKDTDTVRFYESTIDDSKPMTWKRSGSTLSIQYQKTGWNFLSFSQPEKDLTVIVPHDWHCLELDIETASGSISVDALIAQSAEIAGASAVCDFMGCQIDTLSISTVSGDITYEGSLTSFQCESVSAKCDLTLMAKAEEIELEGVSGDLYLTFAEDFGFTAQLSSLSGTFHSQYNTTLDNGHYVYGDGSCQIDADTVSGSINIKKAQ